MDGWMLGLFGAFGVRLFVCSFGGMAGRGGLRVETLQDVFQ